MKGIAKGSKKKVTVVIATVLTAALLLGGTYAWTDFSQSFTNRFRGGSSSDVLLHDDFQAGVNKDVYVENTGENPLIVRVRLNEFFQVGDEIIIGAKEGDENNRIEHKFIKSHPEHCGLITHDYFKWDLSGAQKAYKPGTGEWGNRKIKEGDTFKDGTVAILTLPERKPVTMAEYIENKSAYDTEADGRWILDSDGWAYWSKLLQPGKATNLLLDNVEIICRPDDNYYYEVDVVLEATNRTEVNDMLISEGGITAAGREIVEYLGGISEIPPISSAPQSTAPVITTAAPQSTAPVITTAAPQSTAPVIATTAPVDLYIDMKEPDSPNGYYPIINETDREKDFRGYIESFPGNPVKFRYKEAAGEEILSAYASFHLSDILNEEVDVETLELIIDNPDGRVNEETVYLGKDKSGEDSIICAVLPERQECLSAAAQGKFPEIPVSLILKSGDRTASFGIVIIYAGFIE